jgi:hypothetical protein
MTRLRKWVPRIVAALFGLVCLVLLAGFTYEQIGRSHDRSRLPQRIGQAVDVGGRTLNLYCSGQGSPRSFSKQAATVRDTNGRRYRPTLRTSLVPAGTIAQAWDGAIRRGGREPAHQSSAISTNC